MDKELTFTFGGVLVTSFINGNADADIFGTVDDRAALVINSSRVERVIQFSSAQFPTASSTEISRLTRLICLASSSSIYGGASDSIVTGAAASLANALVKGDKGNDTFTVSMNASQGVSSTNSTLQGGEGKDTINASLATAAILGAGGLGSDSLNGSTNTDTLNGVLAQTLLKEMRV